MRLRDFLDAAEFDRPITIRDNSGNFITKLSMNNHIEYTKKWEEVESHLHRHVTLISTTPYNDLYVEIA